MVVVVVVEWKFLSSIKCDAYMAQLICPLKVLLRGNCMQSRLRIAGTWNKIKINRTVIVDRSISMHNACHDDSDYFKYPLMAKLFIPVCVILETPPAMVRLIILNTRRWLNCWSQSGSSLKCFISSQKAKLWNNNDCWRCKTRLIHMNLWYVWIKKQTKKKLFKHK